MNSHVDRIQRYKGSPDEIGLAAGRVLADERVERRDGQVVTVYSNVACPAGGELWYTFGGHPAASRGDWQKLAWPWTGPGEAHE